eukprot:CAMPEP_0172324700 /NCGR_PEP_ID=MMETSP1058-20130122/52034_1 /TAXON_ID=83371 /ORGANISM="Detonula confervacea, Strain CCMP 353" /LENGTH=49 /DNA_ID= /DNA_START= /DNA_END= /DNA_ORIENTATION=
MIVTTYGRLSVLDDGVNYTKMGYIARAMVTIQCPGFNAAKQQRKESSEW